MVNFLREIEVFIAGFKDYQNNISNQGIRINSDGTNSTIKIVASIEKSKISIPNASQIKLYNLSKDTRNKINLSQATVEIYASYYGENKELVFKGGILNTITTREGADIITSIIAIDGQNSNIRTPISKSYEEGVNVSEVVKSVASEIPGVKTVNSLIDIVGKVGYSGFSLFGTAQSVLNKLGYQFGFSWSIQNGIFQAISDKSGIKSGIRIKDSGVLKKVTPMLSGASQQQTGITIDALFVPGIIPGHIFELQSEIEPRYNGKYVAHTLTIDLDTKGSAWDMRIESFKEG